MKFIKIIFVGFIFAISSQSFAHEEKDFDKFEGCANAALKMFSFSSSSKVMYNCIKDSGNKITFKQCDKVVSKFSDHFLIHEDLNRIDEFKVGALELCTKPTQ